MVRGFEPALFLLAALGCGPRAAKPTTTASGDEITRYRDRAVIKQRVELEVPVADRATVTVQIAAGVGIEDVVVLDRGELTISELRGRSAPACHRRGGSGGARRP